MPSPWVKRRQRLRDLNGDRATRIRSQVETRAQTCEKWLPLWRALNANQGELAELKLRIRLARELIMKRLELMYRPELRRSRAGRGSTR